MSTSSNNVKQVWKWDGKGQKGKGDGGGPILCKSRMWKSSEQVCERVLCNNVVCVCVKTCVCVSVCVWQCCVYVCDNVVCVWQCCVCVRVVCVCVGKKDEERMADGRRTGYRTKNKNPTQKCREWSSGCNAAASKSVSTLAWFSVLPMLSQVLPPMVCFVAWKPLSAASA